MNILSSIAHLPASALVGYIAAFLTTLAFIPQAWMTWKTRSVEGISLVMYSVFTIGVALWLSYGILTKDAPVIIANAITLVLAGFILSLKVYYTAGGYMNDGLLKYGK